LDLYDCVMKQLLTGGHLLFGLSTGPMLAADMIFWFDILQGWHYNIYSDCLYNNNIPFSIKYVTVHACACQFFSGTLGKQRQYNQYILICPYMNYWGWAHVQGAPLTFHSISISIRRRWPADGRGALKSVRTCRDSDKISKICFSAPKASTHRNISERQVRSPCSKWPKLTPKITLAEFKLTLSWRKIYFLGHNPHNPHKHHINI